MTARSIHQHAFVPGPLLLIVPAMLWSSIDIGFQVNRERNPEATRFSALPMSHEAWRVSLALHTH